MIDRRERALREWQWELEAAKREGFLEGQRKAALKDKIEWEINLIRFLQDWSTFLSATSVISER
jgi:hypothetical protein